jgi:transcriptional regulator with XRE-family HTH domain
MRKKLKFKIKSKYGMITKFAEEIGYSRAHISAILHKKAIGSNDFWESVQKALDISDSELMEYIRDINN